MTTPAATSARGVAAAEIRGGFAGDEGWSRHGGPPDALAGDAAAEALFWRARAEELSAQLARVERRLLALSRRLPGRWAPLLACDPEDMPDVAPWPDPLAGWHESTALESAHVATALPRLWDRLDPDASR